MAPSSPKTPNIGSPEKSQDPNPPTTASFTPASSYASPSTRQRSTLLVHHKSPLLVATPPSVTRALAFSHPFILPANKLVGLLSWSSGDPWESFLLVASFWAVVLYGDALIRWTGPILAVVALILGMFSRRYSPLSSTGWTGEKQMGHKKSSSESSSMRHQKSLDEIVETLATFTTRCNALLEPFLQLTDFLSTQRTATSATTRPALTTLFIRILLVTPAWIIMASYPIRLITTRRVVIAVGTLCLSWHSRPARVSRIILWRSHTIRRLASFVTGLNFGQVPNPQAKGDEPPPLPPRGQNQHDVANSFAVKGGVQQSSGVRFTFVVFENQRRWLGLGWTSSLFSYERAAWTDEHLNPSDSKEKFALPEWNDGRRGQDGWGRYTRRRKWYRDAELVEVSPGSELESSSATLVPTSEVDARSISSGANKDTDDSGSSQARKRGFFTRGSRTSAPSSGYAISATFSSDDEPDHRFSAAHQERDGDWGVGDDLKMGLG